MPNIRKAMNKISRGVLSGVAAMALMVTAANVSTCCWFVTVQPGGGVTTPNPRV